MGKYVGPAMLAALSMCSGVAIAGDIPPPALTPQHFQETVSIDADDLEPVAKFNTYEGVQVYAGLLKIRQPRDAFLRAFYDKQTGSTIFQIYQYISYRGEWRFYYGASYLTEHGLVSKDLTKIDSKVVGCSGSRYGGCTLSETVGVPLDEATVREIGARYRDGGGEAWRYRLRSKSGEDFDSAVLPAEAAGLVAAVDAYRAAHPVKPAPSR